MRNDIGYILLALTVLQSARTVPIRHNPHDITNTTSATPAIHATSDETNMMEDYFMKYSGYEKEAIVAAKSVGGPGALDDHSEPTLSPAQSPNFVGSLLNLQRMAGIQPTGNITKETVAITSRSRCGVPDPSVLDTNAPGEYKTKSIWKNKYNPDTKLFHITYSVFENGSPAETNFLEFEQGLASAMCSWELISNLRFKNLGAEDFSADVQIKFEKGDHGDKFPFDGAGRTLAHAFYPNDGRLHLDSEEPWYLATDSEVNYRKKDFYTVMLHELGHTIGLLHSDTNESIMAPFYKYLGTFNTFEIPDDDWIGVANMYGRRRNDDPSSEASSACRELKDRFGIIVPPKAATVDTKTELYAEPTCKDDESASKFCADWKALKYCTDIRYVKTMYKRCKHTCGFCPEAPKKSKPQSNKLSSAVNSICDIPGFDAFATVYDDADGFFAYVFKDDYHFKSKVLFSTVNDSRLSLLNDTDSLTGAYTWLQDPKSFAPGLFQFQTLEFLSMSKKVDAMLTVGTRTIAFDGKRVHIYNQKSPMILFEKAFALDVLFPGYPHASVDAAYVEMNERGESQTYSLFYGNKMWQFQEEYFPEGINKDRREIQPFIPVLGRLDVEIVEWYGVHACDLDSVFSYQGVPYFLKGNTFWPAVDTEPQIPRDITYNFFRCWEEEPKITTMPSNCDREPPGNSANSLEVARTTTYLTSTLFTYFFILYFAKP